MSRKNAKALPQMEPSPVAAAEPVEDEKSCESCKYGHDGEEQLCMLDTTVAPCEDFSAWEAAEETTVPENSSGGTEGPDTPELDDESPLLTAQHEVRKRSRKETIEVTVKLTEYEKLELAGEMAAALAERDKLEADFAFIKKDYKARIDIQVSAAAEAGATFRADERTQDVSCDVFEDRSTLEIVFCDSVTGREVYRRAMTHEERQCKLPLDTPAATHVADSEPATEPTPAVVRPHNCTNCGNFNQSSELMPEPCQTCAQVESGETDNWIPLRVCNTCTHAANAVHLPPCSMCSLNADDEHQGEEDLWTDPAAALVENTASVNTKFDDHDDMPVIPTADTAPHPEV